MQPRTAPQLLQDQQARGANPVDPAKTGLTQPLHHTPSVAPNVIEIPDRLRSLEPADPAQVANYDPVFMTRDAARILGVPASRLEKWRQRDQGPDYLRYEGGYVRYELSALVEFRAARRVRPSRQPHSGRRR